MAALVAEIYAEYGLLKKGHLISATENDLIDKYAGGTPEKTQKLIDTATDGVLFIDEAYTLAQGKFNEYGKQAITTLLTNLEDRRDNSIKTFTFAASLQ